MVEVVKIYNNDMLSEAFSIRNQVFVIEQNVEEELEYDEFEDSSTHYLAMFNGVGVGTARFRKTTNGTKLERFAVLEQYRSKGVGAKLVETLLNEVKKSEKGVIYLHAQVQVVDFYKKYGFVEEGEMFVEAGIQHYKMKLA